MPEAGSGAAAEPLGDGVPHCTAVADPCGEFPLEEAPSRSKGPSSRAETGRRIETGVGAEGGVGITGNSPLRHHSGPSPGRCRPLVTAVASLHDWCLLVNLT